MKNTPTPHNSAAPGDFAKTVLMPGDPLRAKFIAEHFLTDARLVNNVRGIQGYTGTYNGTPVSVMASGMGMPSIGIYSYELYNFYGVENIIRIGSAGGIADGVDLRDLVAGMAAFVLAKYDFPGGKLFFSVVVTALMFSGYVTGIPRPRTTRSCEPWMTPPTTWGWTSRSACCSRRTRSTTTHRASTPGRKCTTCWPWKWRLPRST